MLGNMKSRLNEETNGGKSRGVVMIYSSCEPSRTYGVVLIFFLWVVETIWSSEPNKLVSIQALVASFNLFFREINNHHHDKKKAYDNIGPAYLSRTRDKHNRTELS